MKFKKYLNEKSYTQEDIPKTFRVVFEIDEYNLSKMVKNIKQLSSMKLEGMTGISDKHDIAFQWLGVARDAMLIMKGSEVVKLNKISRMLYGNPNYFLSNKMTMAKRLFNKSGGSDDSNILQNILEYVFKELGKMDATLKHDIEYTAAYQSYAHYAFKKSVNINSTKDLVKWIRKTGNELKADEKKRDWSSYEKIRIVDTIKELSDSQIEKAIYDAFEQIGKIYSDEGEWIIKDKTLTVPKNSHLYVLMNKKEYKEMMDIKANKPDEWKIMKFMNRDEVVKKYDLLMGLFKRYGIFDKYKVKFVDSQEWKRIQSMHINNK
jgi:hypothetical protein